MATALLQKPGHFPCFFLKEEAVKPCSWVMQQLLALQDLRRNHELLPPTLRTLLMRREEGSMLLLKATPPAFASPSFWP